MDDRDIDDVDMELEPPAAGRPRRDRLRRTAHFVRKMALPAALFLGTIGAVLAGVKGMVALSAEAALRPGGYTAALLWTVISVSVAAVLAVLGLREYANAARDHAEFSAGSDEPDEPYYDTVTGLPTMRLFKDVLQQALARVGPGERLVALLLLDLEQVKVLSDRKGSASGDSALRVLTARIKGCLRGPHTVARLGGDEFGVLLEGSKSIDEITHTAEKIRQTVGLPLTLLGEEILINTRIGIALRRTDGKSAEDLLYRASEAKAAAKSHGQPIQIESFVAPVAETAGSRLPAAPSHQ